MNIRVNKVFLKKYRFYKRSLSSTLSFSKLCKKSVEKKFTHNFLGVFMRKRSSRILVFLVFRPRQKRPPGRDKIQKWRRVARPWPVKCGYQIPPLLTGAEKPHGTREAPTTRSTQPINLRTGTMRAHLEVGIAAIHLARAMYWRLGTVSVEHPPTRGSRASAHAAARGKPRFARTLRHAIF